MPYQQFLGHQIVLAQLLHRVVVLVLERIYVLIEQMILVNNQNS